VTRSLCIDATGAGPVRLLTGLAALAVAGVERASRPKPPAALDAGELGDADADDVRRSRDGDGDAYRALVERHQARVGAMMWRFTRDALVHEELVQDVFVEAYRSLPTYRAEAPFAHWLARIATRVGYRYWRRRARERERRTVPLAEWDGVTPARADTMAPSEAAELLHALLDRLPPRDRLVLTLRYVEDHSVEETARLTGWSATMVKVQVWRARRKLRRLLEKITSATKADPQG